MYQNTRRNRNLVAAASEFVAVWYHSTIRNVRVQNGNASLSLLNEIAQPLIILAVFYVFHSLTGLRGSVIWGDYFLFMLTGIFLFITHIRALSAAMGATGPVGGMNMHAPITPVLTLAAKAASFLYLQIAAMMIILIALHVVRGPLEIHNPLGLLLPFVLAWSSAVALGFVIMVVGQFFPRVASMFRMFYRRVQMIASGKMLPANLMPASMVVYFQWNPLFHCIDQIRGEMFVNYFPRYTNLWYPFYFTVVMLLIGMMGEFWLRKNKTIGEH